MGGGVCIQELVPTEGVAVIDMLLSAVMTSECRLIPRREELCRGTIKEVWMPMGVGIGLPPKGEGVGIVVNAGRASNA